MFDIGFAEVFLLTIVGLLVLGPERLPRVARTLGGLARRARDSWHSLQASLESELDAKELREPLDEARRELEAARQDLEQARQRIEDAGTESNEPKNG